MQYFGQWNRFSHLHEVLVVTDVAAAAADIVGLPGTICPAEGLRCFRE